MPATILDLAIASNTVYNFDKKMGSEGPAGLSPPGYSIKHIGKDDATGFFAVAYQKQGESELVLAIRGTMPFFRGVTVGLKNIKSDIGLYAIESLPVGMQAASDFMDKKLPSNLKKENLIVCGHSLGGAMATILAFQRNIPCCAFNAPTVSKMVGGGMISGPTVYIKKWIDRTEIEKSILNFNMAKDFVSKSSKAVGHVVKVPAYQGGGHSQDLMVGAIKSDAFWSKRGFFEELRKPSYGLYYK